MPGANNPWKSKIQKILACGVTKRKQSKSSVLPFGGGSAACTCGCDHEKYDRDNQPTPAAAAVPPLLTNEIPKSVGFDDLNILGGTLSKDLDWTVAANPFQSVQPLQDGELQEELDAHPTFKDCVGRKHRY